MSTNTRPGAAKAKASDGLGPRLRVAREQSAVTVRELARRNGVSPSLVSQVERGLAMASVGTLLASANELSLDIGDLFMHGERHGERHGAGRAWPGAAAQFAQGDPHGLRGPLGTPDRGPGS